MELVNKISSCKDDVVFVGSLVYSVNGELDRSPNDIDIVVTSLDGLERFGEVICYDSVSVFAKDSKLKLTDQKFK